MKKNNDLYPENDYRDYLQHHGILGQRWGVRRFQNKDGSLTSKGKRRYNGSKQAKEEEASNSRKGLTDKQKRAIMIGVGVLGVSLAAYGTYRIAKSGGFDSIMQKLKETKAGDSGLGLPIDGVKPKSLSPISQITEHGSQLANETGLPLKEQLFGAVEDELRANPGYDQSKEEWRNNCSHACLNWCLRKFGLDTEATPMKFDETGGLSFGELKTYIKKTSDESRKSDKFDLAQTIVGNKTMEAYKQALSDRIVEKCKGQNAFGIIKSDLLDGPNHFFGFEIDGGKVVFPNPQNSAVSTDNYFKQMAYGMRSSQVEVFRMDDKEFIAKRVKDFAKPYSH